MAPKITFVGGGSYQWVPKLLVDVANTPSLHGAEIVLEDIDPEPLPRLVAFVEHLATVGRNGLRATGTTDLGAALDGADYVVVCVSTGGLDSMEHDVHLPERYGVHQTVGDTVGPGGIVRALRNVPVLIGIAEQMAQSCPGAWMLNLTNPMTTLTRAVARETDVTVVGLCHEVEHTKQALGALLDVDTERLDVAVAGVNHLPLVVSLSVDGRDDGLERLADLTGRADEVRADDLDPRRTAADPEGFLGMRTKGDLIDAHQVKLELLRRFGALPAAGDRHVVEFFSGFLTEESGWGKRWGVRRTPVAERHLWRAYFLDKLSELEQSSTVPSLASGEMVAAVIDARERDTGGAFPLNLPNAGQCPDLPDEVVVESIGVVDGTGARGRESVRVPRTLAEHLRRVSASQETTVDAALAGDRDLVFEAMLLDPLASRVDYEGLGRMIDEMLAATSPWLPRFAAP